MTNLTKMWHKIKCWLSKKLKKDWHDWEIVSECQSEYEPDLISGVEICRCCGDVRFYSRGRKKDE